MKPNVLHIVNSFEQGGTERQAVQLVRLLNESGRYRLFLATLDGRGILREDAEKIGLGKIPEYPLSSFYDLNFLRQIYKCIHFLRKNQIDIVHTHDFYTNIFGMTAAALAGVKVRIASKRDTEGFSTPAKKQAERVAYKLAHKVITNANAVRTLLIDQGVRSEKLVTIYNGLDLKRVSPPLNGTRETLLDMFRLPTDFPRRFVTIVANLQHAVKDHPTFLRAASRVIRDVPNAAFVLAGEGALSDSLESLAVELGIKQHTFFIGRCQRVAELLSISDVCILSSKAEGFSNSILEYMAAAKPVVVTDVGGAREAVVDGESGFIVASGDDERMASHIVALLSDASRARAMGQIGKSIVENKFSCEAQLANTVGLYDELLAQSSEIAEPASGKLHSTRA